MLWNCEGFPEKWILVKNIIIIVPKIAPAEKFRAGNVSVIPFAKRSDKHGDNGIQIKYAKCNKSRCKKSNDKAFSTHSQLILSFVHSF